MIFKNFVYSVSVFRVPIKDFHSLEWKFSRNNSIRRDSIVFHNNRNDIAVADVFLNIVFKSGNSIMLIFNDELHLPITIHQIKIVLRG